MKEMQKNLLLENDELKLASWKERNSIVIVVAAVVLRHTHIVPQLYKELVVERKEISPEEFWDSHQVGVQIYFQ